MKLKKPDLQILCKAFSVESKGTKSELIKQILSSKSLPDLTIVLSMSPEGTKVLGIAPDKSTDWDNICKICTKEYVSDEQWIEWNTCDRFALYIDCNYY
jgi:hypothetical protein